MIFSTLSQGMAFGDVQHAFQCDARFLEPRERGGLGGGSGIPEGHGSGDPEALHDPARPLLSAFPESDSAMETASWSRWEPSLPQGHRLRPSHQGRDQEIWTAVMIITAPLLCLSV